MKQGARSLALSGTCPSIPKPRKRRTSHGAGDGRTDGRQRSVCVTAPERVSAACIRVTADRSLWNRSGLDMAPAGPPVLPAAAESSAGTPRSDRALRLTRFANDAVFLADSSGTVLQVNERARDFYGYSLDEMIGMKVQAFRAAGTEDDYRRAGERIEKPGQLVPSDRAGKDGSVFPGRWCDDGNGKMAGYRQTIVRDITNRTRRSRSSA